MKMRLTVRGLTLTEDLKEYIERRIHFALGRYSAKIKSLSIRLEDINGPKGGIDKCCQIQVDVGLAQKVIIRECSGTAHAAVANAVDRAERSMERRLNLERRGDTRPAGLRTDFGFGD